MRDGLRDVRGDLAAIAAAEIADPNIAYGTRWWLHDGVRDRAVVLLHGWTNNPRQYLELGAQLHADGHNVIAPRFPRHGYADRMTAAVADLTMEELVATSLEALVLAAQVGKAVDLVGISVSATIGIYLAARTAIDTVIAVSPFLGIRHLSSAANAGLAAVLERLPNAFLWWDPIHREKMLPLHAYPRFPTQTLARALRFGEAAAQVSAGNPHARRLVLFLNARDPIVNNELSAAAAQRLAGDLAVNVIVRHDFPPRHDVIEPALPGAQTELVYTALRDLIASRR